MTIPVWVLLLFAGWTLTTLLGTTVGVYPWWCASVAGLDQMSDGEEILRIPDLRPFVEVPTFLTGVCQAWQRGLGGVLQLNVGHDDARSERKGGVIRIVGTWKGLLSETPFVDPYLPQLAVGSLMSGYATR